MPRRVQAGSCCVAAQGTVVSPAIVLVRAFVLVLLLVSIRALAVEHPGVLPKDAECSSCHADKLRGESVHSAMVTTCSVCHVSRTQGDMMSMTLAMPKQRICSACHQESAELRRHSTAVNGGCVDCHDAHSSSRKMLLREVAELPPSILNAK